MTTTTMMVATIMDIITRARKAIDNKINIKSTKATSLPKTIINIRKAKILNISNKNICMRSFPINLRHHCIK